MPREPASTAWQIFARFASVALVTAALFFAREVLVPFALAVLLSFLLMPLVEALERLRMSRVVASALTVILAAAGVFALGWAVYAQLEDLSDSLPGYQENIRRKIAPLRGENPVEKIEKEIAKAVEEKPSEEKPPAGTPPPRPDLRAQSPEPRPTGTEAAPVAVKVVPGVPTPFEFLSGLLGPLVDPIATFGIVFVLVLFLLIYQQDLRNRFIRIVSPTRIAVTTQALTEASQRTSRYLLMTLVVNATYGIPVGIGLHLLGIPNALLWGLFATLLRFIPYLGPWIAAAFPIALSIAVSPDWSLTAWVLGMFVVLELVSNNVVEPLVYGRGTGLSPLAIIAAAVFWTWLWGVPGLFLSIPLTLCLVVMGRHVPPLAFLSVLLGDEPSLAPGERYYQRLVAADAVEAAKVTEEHLRGHDLLGLYDEVLVPALRLAKRDDVEGHLRPEAVRFVRGTTRELLEDLSEEPAPLRKQDAPASEEAEGLERVDAAAGGAPGEGAPVPRVEDFRIGFLPAGDETDALTGPMLADVLRRVGLDLHVFGGNALVGELQAWVKETGARVVCIGGLAPHAIVRARHLYKRLKTAVPDVRILVALWGVGTEPGSGERPKVEPPDRVAATVAEALGAVRALAAETANVAPTQKNGG
jgi:predicted PurR-regulated permease PerM